MRRFVSSLGIHSIETCGVLRLRMELLLKFSKVPLRELLIHGVANLPIQVRDLEVKVAADVLLLLDILFDLLGQDLPEHGDKMVVRKSHPILVFELHPLS